MGTTASAAQQPVSSGAFFESPQGVGTMESRPSLGAHQLQTTALHNIRAKSIIPNKVAPVMITYNCKEEFQIHDELLKAHYTLGQLSDASPEHYLVQGRYFLVRDVAENTDILGTKQSCGAPNFRQARSGLAVFGMGQPSLLGFRRVLQKLQKEGHRDCLIFCVREEPVLFLRAGDDFVSYTPRDKQNLQENVQGLRPGGCVESLELAIRKEIHDFAQLSENTYHVYPSPEDPWGKPHTVAVRGEDEVHVSGEVFRRPLFLQPTYRYHRLPLSEHGSPLEPQLDAFVSVLRETPSLLPLRDACGPAPALLFSCQTGMGRANLGMALGALVLFHHGGIATRSKAVAPQNKPLPMEQLQVVQSFVHLVSQGRKMVEEVDRAVSACAELHDLRDVILDAQRTKEGGPPGSLVQGSHSMHGVQQRALRSLEYYFYLILFNYYLHEQYPLAFALNFSRWLCSHPELYRLPVTLSPATSLAPQDLMAQGALVPDDLMSPDALGTLREMDVANFRRVPRMPIYGTAQPSTKALGCVLAHLTGAKRKLQQVMWVNLREELVVQLDGHPHSLLWSGPALDPHQLEALEAQLKAHLSVPPTGAQAPHIPKFQSCLTTQEVFSQLQGTFPGLTYHRIPLPDLCAPHEEDFDRLLETLRVALADEPATGFVFSCLSGRGRTTMAMVLAVLAFWHIRGFPEVDEEDLVSVPDAKFTKGEFEPAEGPSGSVDTHCHRATCHPLFRDRGQWLQQLDSSRDDNLNVVMKVVQLLPDGHRVKREVDAALDTVSETMTPMHYHLREIIICSYRQAKAAKTEHDAERLHLRSLQYLERYLSLVLFNAYLHLEKAAAWQRPFSTWMREVASKAGVYEILNSLGFPEFEGEEQLPFSQLRCRWQEQRGSPESLVADDFL